MKLSTFALYAVAAAALAVSAAALPTVAKEMTVEVGGAPMYPSKNIIQNAVNSKDHTTLVAAVKAAGLVDTLQGPGPFTVFAPTNDALPSCRPARSTRCSSPRTRTLSSACSPITWCPAATPPRTS